MVPPITKSLNFHAETISLGVGVSIMMGKGGRSYTLYIDLGPLGAIRARREWKGEKELERCEVTT